MSTMSAVYISNLMIITETLTWKLPCRDNYRAVKNAITLFPRGL